jgi:signal transduction histidine kinase
MVERRDWDAYALRYETAMESGAGRLVDGVWFVEIEQPDADADRRLVLYEWRPEARAFAPAEWPDVLEGLHDRLAAQTERRPSSGRGGGPREIFGSSDAFGDERTLVMPMVRLRRPPPMAPGSGGFRTDVRLRGYTILRLDTEALARDRLPALVAAHFPALAEYRIAVVGNQDQRVLFESSPGAAADTAGTPDLSTPFMQPHVSPMMVLAQIEPDNPARADSPTIAIAPPPLPPPPGAGPPVTQQQVVIEMRDRAGDRMIRARTFPHAHGHWTLRVKHAAGSLEAAVAASRRRNLLLSGGVLALLGVVVGLIAVSARRAHGLARQQMEFVAAVSHELRTPVAVINSAAGNLADGVVADPARVKRYGETIQGEARRLGETVERVLQLAGLGSGRPLPMAALAVAELVREAVQRQADDAARAGVEVQMDIAPGVPDILGDAGSLHSAIQNLVGNAVKYSGPDRWARVSVSAAGAPQREVRIAVEDHGAGLDHEERRLVFEPFYRGRDAVANQVQGSGLGLSLVRRIAEAHGGRVEVDSEVGRGSTFTLCLPAAPETPLATAHPSAGAPEPAAPPAS